MSGCGSQSPSSPVARDFSLETFVAYYRGLELGTTSLNPLSVGVVSFSG